MAFLSSSAESDAVLSRARQELDPTLWSRQVTIV